MDKTLGIKKNDLQFEITKLVKSLDTGTMQGVAYDTSWVAAIAQPTDQNSPLFPQSLKWLKQNQKQDGSWGGAIGHRYDRVLSTLSAIRTLLKYTKDPEAGIINAGLNYLNSNMAKLHEDPIDTVGFELIAPELVIDLRNRGLAVADVPSFIERARYEKKRLLGKDLDIYSSNSPSSFSIEFMGNGLDCSRATDLIGQNGSVAGSPSATAYLAARCPMIRIEAYLKGCLAMNGDGSVPTVYPFELFESCWVLFNILVSGITIWDFGWKLAILKYAWENKKTAWANIVSFQDLDELAVMFALLDETRLEVSPKVFTPYETATHFECYRRERTPSVSTNAHLLFAIDHCRPFNEKSRWKSKLITYLRESQSDQGFWTDKWHVSPYYATAQSVFALATCDSESVSRATDWILQSQLSNGLWGFMDGNAEETALALQGLLYPFVYGANTRSFSFERIYQPVRFLFTNLQRECEYPELWVAKVLYTPTKIIKSSILSALSLFIHVMQDQSMKD